MAKKKKETTGLLMAVTPITVREEKKKGGLLEPDRQGYQVGGMASKIAKLLTGRAKRGPKGEMEKALVPPPEKGAEPRALDPSEVKSQEDAIRAIEETESPFSEFGDPEKLEDVFRASTLSPGQIAEEATTPFNEVELMLARRWFTDFRGDTPADLYIHVGEDKKILDSFYDEVGLYQEAEDAISGTKLSGATSKQVEEFDEARGKIDWGDDPPFAKGGLLASDRQQYQVGGMPPLPPEMLALPPPQEAMPQEAILPDEQMEDGYLDFVVSQSLNEEEENYLMNSLEADPRLSIIFDKIMDTATEFSGAGPVDGPGSEVSDSIPARLSDGEFVLTAKATDELGTDNVQAMMDEAEARSDERQLVQTGGVIRPDLEKKTDELGRPINQEIRKGMLGVNPRLQQSG